MNALNVAVRNLCVVSIMAMSCLSGHALAQAFTNSFERSRIGILLGANEISLMNAVDVLIYDTEIMTEYTCTDIILRSEGLSFLVPAEPGTFDPRKSFPPRLGFYPLEDIDRRWAPWPRQDVRIGLLSYSWSQTRPDWPPGYVGRFDRSDGASSFIIGLKVEHADGVHYGWLHMTRPAAGVTNLFEFESYAIHPVPDEPIQAGVEPPAPALTAEPGDPGSGTAFILRWPAGYSDNAGYRLESTEDLAPPVEWQLVEAYSGEHLVPVGMENRFYRLRSP